MTCKVPRRPHTFTDVLNMSPMIRHISGALKLPLPHLRIWLVQRAQHRIQKGLRPRRPGHSRRLPLDRHAAHVVAAPGTPALVRAAALADRLVTANDRRPLGGLNGRRSQRAGGCLGLPWARVTATTLIIQLWVEDLIAVLLDRVAPVCLHHVQVPPLFAHAAIAIHCLLAQVGMRLPVTTAGERAVCPHPEQEQPWCYWSA